jgi:hypothetical protein
MVLLQLFRGVGFPGVLIALAGFWIYFSFPAAALAKRRGRSYSAWLLLSLLISPAFSLLALMISESARTEWKPRIEDDR